jgi:hypothetical protein
MKVMHFKVIAALVAVVALTGVAVGTASATSRPNGTTASASTTPSTPAGGSVKIFVTPSATGNGGGAVVITGAIGDYGKTTGKMDKNGKANKNGNYGKSSATGHSRGQPHDVRYENEQRPAEHQQYDLLGGAGCDRSGDAV